MGLAIAWLVLALILGGAEMLTGAFFALFLAAGALFAAIAAAFGLPVFAEVTTFAIVSVLGVIVARPPLMAYLTARSSPQLLSGAQAMLGEAGQVVERIGGRGRPGHVRVAGESWPALPADGRPIEPGTQVVVVGLRRTRVVVQAIEGRDPNAAQEESGGVS